MKSKTISVAPIFTLIGALFPLVMGVVIDPKRIDFWLHGLTWLASFVLFSLLGIVIEARTKIAPSVDYQPELKQILVKFDNKPTILMERAGYKIELLLTPEKDLLMRDIQFNGLKRLIKKSGGDSLYVYLDSGTFTVSVTKDGFLVEWDSVAPWEIV